jgi:hypothetical protein
VVAATKQSRSWLFTSTGDCFAKSARHDITILNKTG